MQTICQQILINLRLNKMPAQKGRIKSEWIAELFFTNVFVFIINSIAEELIAELYWPVPALLVLPD